MAITTQDLLDATNQKILDILTGAQSYGLRGRYKNEARLAELEKLRDNLLQKLAAESSGGAVSLGMQVPTR